MATEKDIKTIRNADGRGFTKVLVISTSANGLLLNCVRADGLGSGAVFVAKSSQLA